MSRTPLPKLPAAFTYSEGIAAGVSPHRLRGSELHSPFRGARVRVPATCEPPLAVLLRLCAAYATVAPPGYRFSHVTAARLLLIPLPARLERRRELDVAVTKGRPVPRGAAVIGHRLTHLGERRALGHPIVSPELVWIQLATLLKFDDLIAAGDHLVQRKGAVCTLRSLATAISTSRSRGTVLARRALADVRAGTESPRETWMRLAIVGAGLPEPAIGQKVFDERGRYVGRPDLAYRTQRIAIEYEGDGHRTDPGIFQQDIQRRERFEDAGWRVIRVTDADFLDPASFLKRVARALQARS